MMMESKKRKPGHDGEKPKKVKLNAKDKSHDLGDEDIDYNYTGDDEDTSAEFANEDYHGNKIEPFNMKQELEEGYFDDKSGSYVEKKKGGEARDAWLDDYDEASKDKHVKFATLNKEEEAALANDHNEKTSSREDFVKHMMTVVRLLQPQERVLNALKRLTPPPRPKTKAKGQQPQQQEDTSNTKSEFDELTEAADNLLNNGHYNSLMNADIYQYTRERAQELLRKDEAAEQTADDGVKWEYKPTDDSSEVYGPYTTPQMVEWHKQGYFHGNQVVQVRQVTPDGVEHPFVRSDTINFLSYL